MHRSSQRQWISAYKNLKPVQKGVDKTSKAYEEQSKELKKNADANRSNVKSQTLVGQSIDGLKNKYDLLKQALLNSSMASNSFYDKLASGMQTTSQALMGFSMLSSSMENLGEMFGGGEITLSSFISTLSSMAFGMLSLMPILTKIGGKMNEVWIKGSLKRVAAGEQEKVAAILSYRAKAKAAREAGDIEQAEAHETMIAKAMEGLSGIASQVAQGPPGWVTAAISLVPFLAILGGLVGSVAIPKGKAKKEEKQQEKVSKKIEKGQENLELIDEYQEESDAVKDLTEEYKNLQAAGESTYDTFNELVESIPNLIDKYRELDKALDLDFNIAELEAAYEYFKKTGDISKFEAAQEKADAEVAEAEAETNKAVADDTAWLAARKASGKNRNSGKVVGGNMELRVRRQGKNGDALDILESVMGDSMDRNKDGGKILKFKTGTPNEMLQTYEKMGEAIKQMKSKGLSSTNVYERVASLYESLGEQIGDVEAAQDEVVSAAKSDWAAGTSDSAKRVNSALAEKGINLDKMSIEEYKNNRDEILKQLEKEYNITREQAEELLMSNSKTKTFELGISLFADDGKIASDLKQGGSLALSKVQEWYESLSEEDKTLFINKLRGEKIVQYINSQVWRNWSKG